MPRVTPAFASSSSVRPYCDVRIGRLQMLSTPPRLAARLITLSLSKTRKAASWPPFTSIVTMPPKPLICCRGDRVIGMRRQARVVDALDRRMPLEELRHGQRVRVVLRDAQRHRLHAAPERERRLRIHDAAEQPAHLRDRRHQRLRSRQHAAGDVAVAVQVLGAALHRQIDAHRQHRLIDRARKGVVDRRQDAGLLARRRDRADVDAAQRRIDRRLEPDDLRLRTDHRSDVRELVDRDEAMGDAEPAAGGLR